MWVKCDTFGLPHISVSVTYNTELGYFDARARYEYENAQETSLAFIEYPQGERLQDMLFNICDHLVHPVIDGVRIGFVFPDLSSTHNNVTYVFKENVMPDENGRPLEPSPDYVVGVDPFTTTSTGIDLNNEASDVEWREERISHYTFDNEAIENQIHEIHKKMMKEKYGYKEPDRIVVPYSFAQYSEKAWETAKIDKVRMKSVAQFTLKLNGEAGEVAELIGKWMRGDYRKVNRRQLTKELGDVLWYINALAKLHDIPLEDVAKVNVEKVHDRKKRGKIKGSGDNR